MTVDEGGSASTGRIRYCMIIAAALVLTASGSVFARGWNRKAAERAFEEARRLHSLIEGKSSPAAPEQYLDCIRTYQRVYLSDPHFGASDDAAFEAARLYQEMGEKFGGLEFYKLAAKLYRFLISDYPASPKRPEALLRMEDLSAGPLGDGSSVRKEERRLKTRPPFSETVQQVASVPKDTLPEPSPPSGNRTLSRTRPYSSVYGVRHWSTTEYTRVIIDLDQEARYERTRLGDPDRVFFDLHASKLTPDLSNKTFVVGDQLLKQVRLGQNRLDVVRVVLDLAGAGDFSVIEKHDPFRIIIDIHKPTGAKPAEVARTTRAKVTQASESGNVSAPLPAATAVPQSQTVRKDTAPQTNPRTVSTKGERIVAQGKETAAPVPAGEATPAQTTQPVSADARKPSPTSPPSSEPGIPVRAARPTSRGDRTMTRMLGLKIGRIVLDPGHGGHDTGTIGPGGTREKDLVLQVATQLKKLLEDRLGAEVVLTRNDDTFIPLEERTAIANQHQADLFVSIHANSSRSRSASGVETYYLNFARTEEAREVAARENASTVRNVRDLQDLVKIIAQAEKSAESRELAALMQKKLYLGTQKVYRGAQDRGVRSAPFVVLIGANMPSVLAEVGFISNPRDERLLRRETNRNRLAEALFDGIAGYMKTLGSDVALNNPH